MYIYWRHGFPVRSRQFPDLRYTLEDGLLACGGEYSGACFREAYLQGIFPWPNEEMDAAGLIPWFCPLERFVLFPNELHVSHSLRKTLKKHPFRIMADHAFEDVVHACAEIHREDGVWITDGMQKAFIELHEMGMAHSIECYLGDELVGGFYGTCIGRIFGGESMFMRVSDATKVAFSVFTKRAEAFGIKLIDCQCYTDNMSRYGAREVPREVYLDYLNQWGKDELSPDFWDGEWQLMSNAP